MNQATAATKSRDHRSIGVTHEAVREQVLYLGFQKDHKKKNASSERGGAVIIFGLA